MIILDELRVEMVGYRKEMEELADVLDIKGAKKRIAELNEETAKDGFWDDLENSQKVLQETKTLEKKIEKFNRLNESLEDIITLIELSIEEVGKYTECTTFGERFVHAVIGSKNLFLNFLEWLLYFIIYMLPIGVVVGLIVWGIIVLTKRIPKKKTSTQQPVIRNQDIVQMKEKYIDNDSHDE